jgi:hypothetical protein
LKLLSLPADLPLLTTAPTWLNCVTDCTWDNNKGWRLVYFTVGGFITILSILRVTVINLQETPKYLLAANRDEDLMKTLHYISNKYSRHCSLTLEQLEACGTIQTTHARNKWSLAEILVHVRGLFATKRRGLSTTMIWLSWTITGVAGPLFFLFLPSVAMAPNSSNPPQHC